MATNQTLRGRAHGVSFGGFVVQYNRSTSELYLNATAHLFDKSMSQAFNDSVVTSDGDNAIYLYGNSTAYISGYNKSDQITYCDAFDNSRVFILANDSQVRLWNLSTAWSSSAVSTFIYDNATATLKVAGQAFSYGDGCTAYVEG